jgi:Fic family protein
MTSYQPPYKITERILSLVADISEAIGKLSALEELRSLRLRRINQIRTIHGSLAIEGNTLTEEQITAILEGKPVIAPKREVQEVKNAIEAYESLKQWTAHKKGDLLQAHELLLKGLLSTQGHLRSKGVGVMKGTEVVHMAPPADRVEMLLERLLGWLEQTELHPLVASSIFHYEFEFIHPFEDGNGRMGRLWQTLILSKWNALFTHVPVETLVFQHQQDYYEAINQSNISGDCSGFIEFILNMILKAIQTAGTPEVAPEVTPEVKSLLSVITSDHSRVQLQDLLGLKDEKHFRTKYLNPALDLELIERTIPDKPNSRLQRYRLTDKGLQLKG